jgi:2-dehydropantoate 2-reductase
VRIFVYGAGNIGRLYAARLCASGQEVSILARGRRLEEIREHGILLEDAASGERTATRVRAVERLDPDDACDLVLAALPGNALPGVLPDLAAHAGTSVLFFGNNVAGPQALARALGGERVLLGFPGAAGMPVHGRIRYLVLSAREQPTTIGELDGSRSPRIAAIAEVLRGSGFPVSICSDMDAWLKTHAAEIVPTALALYAAGVDARRLARTRDALVLMLRAIREGYGVLSAHGIPVIPLSHRIFRWLPELLLLPIMRRVIRGEGTEIKIGHARAARDEMESLAAELRALAGKASTATPALDRLARHLDPETEPLPDGCAEIPVSWSLVR